MKKKIDSDDEDFRKAIKDWCSDDPVNWYEFVKPGDMVVPCSFFAGTTISSPEKVVGVLNDKASPERSMICTVSPTGGHVWSSVGWFRPHEAAHQAKVET